MIANWDSPVLSEIVDLIRLRSGLVFPQGRVRDVQAAVQRVVERSGEKDARALLGTLQTDSRMLEALVAELTIGESYFGRDADQFELIRRRILPELLESRAATQRVRIWSAGCASGEEPYSLAILFDELGQLHRADVLGTDIARARLKDAQRALYSKWSLRASPDAYRRRYFEERGRFFQLADRIRKQVHFGYLNLAEDTFPSLGSGVWGMDLILCRNVLIYFDVPTVERVAGRLIASLDRDGWLILGASDPMIGELVDCEVVPTSAGMVYRRRVARAGQPASLASWGSLTDSTASPQTWPPIGPPDLASVSGADEASTAPEVPEAGEADRDPGGWRGEVAGITDPDPGLDTDAGQPQDSATDPPPTAIAAAYAVRRFDQVCELAASAGRLEPGDWIAWVRALANLGRLDEAGKVAAHALETVGPSAELLYLDAILMLQIGRFADAERLARQALYLDRRMIVTHLALAEAQRRQGRIEPARRSLRNAASLLTELAPDANVPVSDGETVGRMAELVRSKLKLLQEVE